MRPDTPMTIRPGSRVRCIKRGLWRDEFGEHWAGPEYGSEWVVKGIDVNVIRGRDRVGLELYGFFEGRWWVARHFVPIDDGLEELRRIAAAPTNPDREAPLADKVRERA